MSVKLKLTIVSFLQFAIWGAYLTSMGGYLGKIGLGANIGTFYSVQGVVAIFMPAIMGIIADRWISAPKLLGISHFISSIAMLGVAYYGISAGDAVRFEVIFPIYALALAFYMPTIALSYSTSYGIMEKEGLDTIKHFPPIRTFGTIGFICSMIFVDIVNFQHTPYQFILSAILGVVLAAYCFTLPKIEIVKQKRNKTFAEAIGLDAFALFKQKKLAIFLLFSMLLGSALQISNAYANPFIMSFADKPEFASTFGVQHPNILISISQISETLFILLIPFCLRRWGIKTVMLMAMFAWVLRFGLFGIGDPGSGLWMFILSMIVYGIAFDFFNISGSLFVNQSVDSSIKSSAQGLFVLMTNGIGTAIGTIAAQAIVNNYVFNAVTPNWSIAWYIFAAYSLVVGVLFAIFFKK